MSIISAGDTGGIVDLPEIPNSLRFDGSNDYLSRTFGAGNQQKWTYSGWVKQSKFGEKNHLMTTYTSVSDYSLLSFATNGFINGNDVINFYCTGGAGGTTCALATSSFYRDPSAWLHVVVSVDTTQATAADRIKIYVNGTQVTSFSTATYPNQNANLYRFNSAIAHYFGVMAGGTYGYFNGYLSNICFVDGQAKAPSDFAYTDPNGQWRSLSKASLQSVVNTGGANSFFLSFDNGTSTTTLGNDASSKGNNWTLTNMVRDGSVSDCWSYDTPTNNFAILNPLVTGAAGASISEGSLKATFSASVARNIPTNAIGGKWYCEFVTTTGGDCWGGLDSLYRSNGQRWNGSAYVAYGATYTTNDVIGCALNADTNTVEYFKNGVSQGAFTAQGVAGAVVLCNVYGNGGGIVVVFNFGQRPVASGQWYPDAGGYFRYAPPTGYKALSTKNLPVPTGAAASPRSNFSAVTWTGDTTNKQVATGFIPDFVWAKRRNGGDSHYLYDVIRGVNTNLQSNSSAAEATVSYGLDFDNGAYLDISGSGYFGGSGGGSPTFVGWLWKAGGAAVSNTAGTITSQVSANPAAGFSIVTYTGTGAAATVGHGLGVVPRLIIAKARNAANGWGVGCKYAGSGWNAYLTLHLTNAAAGGAMWNNTDPTSSVFSVGGAGWGINESSTTNVAYCFAEVPGFSKIGSYTGNGSSDGPFVWCGFRPKYVLMKRTDSTSYWIIHDATRSPYNATISQLFPNGPDSEYSTTIRGIDLLANGFKFRESRDDGLNINGGTYIFMAFAEAPFKYANAR